MAYCLLLALEPAFSRSAEAVMWCYDRLADDPIMVLTRICPIEMPRYSSLHTLKLSVESVEVPIPLIRLQSSGGK